jgi:hypothetical protein
MSNLAQSFFQKGTFVPKHLKENQMNYIPRERQAFGEWINTAPKEQVMPYLKRALTVALRLGHQEAVDQIQAVINQVEKE